MFYSQTMLFSHNFKYIYTYVVLTFHDLSHLDRKLEVKNRHILYKLNIECAENDVVDGGSDFEIIMMVGTDAFF